MRALRLPIAGAALLLLISSSARGQGDDEPVGRTSIGGDPFADEPPDAPPDGEQDPVDGPAAGAPSPASSAGKPGATRTSTGPRVLVLAVPSAERDRTAAIAVGDAAGQLLAARRDLTPVTAREVLDPDRALRARRARAAALALAARAQDSLDALELEVARDAGEEAVLALAALPAGDREVDAALQAAILGMAVAALYDGDVLRADEAFVALASLLAVEGRDAVLLADPRRYPSKVLQRFEATRRELESRSTGRIELRTSPEGATVRVDGVERGRTPTEVGGLAEGLHVVTLEAVGHATTAALVDVLAAEVVPVERTLSTDPLAEALTQVPSHRDLEAAVAWARGLGLGWLFLGETSALGTVRGAWIDVASGRAQGAVEVALGGGDESSARALVGAIEAAERAALVPPDVALAADDDGSLVSRWWFWAGLGGALALAAAGAAVAVAIESDDRPRGTAIFGF